MANKQLFLNNFTGVFVASVKNAPVTGTPATELDYGILRLSDGVSGVLLAPTGGDYYILTAYKKVGTSESSIEIMRVTAVSNSVPGECRVTVLRGQEDTPVQGYVAGDYVAMRWTKGGVANLLQAQANLSDLPSIPTAKSNLGLNNVDNTSDANKPVSTAQATAIGLKEAVGNKDASNGYAGLTAFKLNLRNAANTFTGFLTNTATAVRTWTLPDRTGTLADDTDLATKANKGANTDITSLAGLASINGGQLAGMRNVIINGACNVQQRASFVASAGLYGYGGPDRFYANNSAVGQFTQAASTLTFGGQVKDTVRQTVNTATSTFTTTALWGGISQFIEGLNTYHLKDKPLVVSFIFNTNVSGTYSVTVADGPAGYSYVSTFAAVANTPVKVSVAVPVIPSAASIPRTNDVGLRVYVGLLNQATYQTATLNTWLTGLFLTSSTQTNWAATAGNFIELTELQVEAGTVATPFEQRPYSAELIMCQRYFEVLQYQYLFMPLTAAFMYIPASFKVSKRTIPSIVLPATTNLGITAGGGFYTPVLAVVGASADAISLSFNHSAAVGGCVAFKVDASAEL